MFEIQNYTIVIIMLYSAWWHFYNSWWRNINIQRCASFFAIVFRCPRKLLLNCIFVYFKSVIGTMHLKMYALLVQVTFLLLRHLLTVDWAFSICGPTCYNFFCLNIVLYLIKFYFCFFIFVYLYDYIANHASQWDYYVHYVKVCVFEILLNSLLSCVFTWTNKLYKKYAMFSCYFTSKTFCSIKNQKKLMSLLNEFDVS